MKPFLGVLFTLLLGLASAAGLTYIAKNSQISAFWVVISISLVLGLNALRFYVWGALHKKYPLSTTYPMTAFYFPLILVLAYFWEENIFIEQVLGCIVLSLGVVVLSINNEAKDA